jgi:hypothetical protein
MLSNEHLVNCQQPDFLFQSNVISLVNLWSTMISRYVSVVEFVEPLLKTSDEWGTF